jgi:hypothetical protein
LRGFLDSILAFISCSTLSDAEWATINTLNDLSYTLANYTALLGILDARESVSTAKDRLKYYFKAASVEIPETGPAVGKTDIFIGSEL